ncbi:PREDICTED: peroxisome biogenesis factor 2-like [Branchiostoma belcheri]|uniref:Peroxisome biogenesis factor 2 n=1 Tax=Branchiostoma belcheri TaxID=7741 RepID=A0A6P5ALR7_BRABE|nr:PREDICTED: peroxisome biogenesis factor 2-like [Branchiostoma belcheri]
MAASEDDIPPVLRVSQLDAAELDSAILQHLKSQVSRLFQYFKPGILARVEPEVNACLRFLLWKFTIHTASATVGQKLLNLRYSGSLSPSAGLTDRQKLLYALIVVGGKWLQDRSHDLAGWTGRVSLFQSVFKVLSVAENCLKVASVLNFLVFLQQGRYQSLLERALSIQPVYNRKQDIRQVSFEYMTRELLWHGFAEFLFFLLPLINIRRWKNVVTNQLLGSVRQDSDVNLRGPVELRECAVCGEWPTNPHDIGCQHVFCFYCIKANQLADPGFSCPSCSQPANQIRPVNSVPVTIMSS